MSISLRMLVPEATSNYVLNPQLRYDTTGWTANGSTISRVITRARFGIASLKVVTNGSVLNEGAFYRASNLSTISDVLTASVYVRGTGKVRLRLKDNFLGNQWVTLPTVLSDNWWIRLSISGNCFGSNDMRLYVETAENSAKAITFYVDGAQMERKPYATSYCDGDQPGCRWNLYAHNSISSRAANTRQGGRWIDLAGACRKDDHIYVTLLGGLGMPTITNNIQPWANAPGGYYQDSKVQSRIVTMNFHVKNTDRGFGPTKSIAILNELRQQLIDVFKPDVTKANESFLFEYSDGDRPLYIKLRYDAGLEGEWDIRNRWTNSFPIRFVATEPYLFEDSQDVQTLSFQKTFAAGSLDHKSSYARIDGEWTDFAPVFLQGNASVVAIGKFGEVYYGGDFSQVVGGVPAGCAKIAYWDGTSWKNMGSGANGAILCIAAAPNGDIYVGGAFTSIGGVAANYIAKWTISTGLWSALGTGLNNSCRALCFGPSGELYAGGDFTTAGGVAVAYFARWMSGGWAKVGSPNLLTSVYAIVNAKDGDSIYVAGGNISVFNEAVLRFSISANTFYPTDTGHVSSPRGTVYALALTKSGILYAGGDFTLGSSGTVSYSRLVYFNGGGWFAVSSGANATVRGLSLDNSDTLYIMGDFSTIGGVSIKHIAAYNGINFSPIDFIENKNSVYTGSRSYSIAPHPNGDLYLSVFTDGGNDTLSVAPSINTVNNSGSAEVYPFLYIKGPGVLRYVENQTSGKRVYFNLTIVADEEVFIDFAKRTVTSNLRDLVTYSVLPASDFSDMTLIPGSNKLAVFMTNDVASSMSIGYTPQHWSADAVVKAEAL